MVVLTRRSIMRILLTTEFFLSGQSTHVLDLAIQLQKLGHPTELILTGIHTTLFQSHYGPQLKKAGVVYHNTNNKVRLNQIVRSFQPDIIHSHSSTIFDLTKSIAQQNRVPYVVTCHGLGFSHPKYRASLAGAEQIIAVGPNSAAEIKDRFEEKIVIIPNGVDIERFTPAKKETKLNVYYVGRLDWSKVEPIKKLADAVAQIPNMSLTIVGNWKPPVEAEFMPWQTNIEKLLGRANIVVGCGRTAREALAAGCVVLLMNTRYDGIIDHQLVQEPDFDFSGNQGRFRFKRLLEDLSSLAANRKRIRRLQRFSRAYAVENLNSREMAQKVLAVYVQAVSSFRSKARINLTGSMGIPRSYKVNRPRF